MSEAVKTLLEALSYSRMALSTMKDAVRRHEEGARTGRERALSYGKQIAEIENAIIVLGGVVPPEEAPAS